MRAKFSHSIVMNQSMNMNSMYILNRIKTIAKYTQTLELVNDDRISISGQSPRFGLLNK